MNRKPLGAIAIAAFAIPAGARNVGTATAS